MTVGFDFGKGAARLQAYVFPFSRVPASVLPIRFVAAFSSESPFGGHQRYVLMRLRCVFLLLCWVAFSADSKALAESLPTGWEASAPSDATMDKGRRFICIGPDCPAGALLCLHAEAPGNPGKDRTLRIKDMLRPKAFPWKDFEAWLIGKAADLKPDLGSAAMSANGGFADKGVAESVRLGERAFLWRRYAIRTSETSEAIQVAFWVTDNRLNTAFCIVPTTSYALATPRIEAFFDAMNRSPPDPLSSDAGN